MNQKSEQIIEYICLTILIAWGGYAVISNVIPLLMFLQAIGVPLQK